MASQFEPHLRSDATPEVGVERARLQHGRHQRQVFRHQQAEHPGVGQQVVAVHELQGDTGGLLKAALEQQQRWKFVAHMENALMRLLAGALHICGLSQNGSFLWNYV